MFEIYYQAITSEDNREVGREYFYTEPKCRSRIDELRNTRTIKHMLVKRRIYANGEVFHSYIYYRI